MTIPTNPGHQIRPSITEASTIRTQPQNPCARLRTGMVNMIAVHDTSIWAFLEYRLDVSARCYSNDKDEFTLASIVR
jgi:hypothetical protein